MVNADTEQATRQRVLQAAAEIFARQGFEKTTVREICLAAGANVAAVNYHFRDKQALYDAVLDYGYALALEKYPPTFGLGEKPTPEDRLHAFVRSFLHRLLGEGAPAWHGCLLARELSQPTGLLDKKVEQHVRPMFKLLTDIVREFIADSPESVLRRSAQSIVGQVLFYRHAQPVLLRLGSETKFGPVQIEQIAEHITQFSLAALRGIARDKGKKP